jgi:hypothetical protein
MSETRILIRLLWTYFPQNWQFGSALSKLLNFVLGGFESPPSTPLHTAGSDAQGLLMCEYLNVKKIGSDQVLI